MVHPGQGINEKFFFFNYPCGGRHLLSRKVCTCGGESWPGLPIIDYRDLYRTASRSWRLNWRIIKSILEFLIYIATCSSMYEVQPVTNHRAHRRAASNLYKWHLRLYSSYRISHILKAIFFVRRRSKPPSEHREHFEKITFRSSNVLAIQNTYTKTRY